ncbi:hypothetical protein [Methylobacterium sp. JK268]
MRFPLRHFLRTGTATFTRADGTTGTAAELNLRVDNQNSRYQGDAIAVTADAAAAPDLKGHGTLVSLREALSHRTAGIGEVQAALATITGPDLKPLVQAIRPVLTAWVEGSPLRLADGTMAEALPDGKAYPDISVLRSSDNKLLDYAYDVADKALTSDDQRPTRTWWFASGTILSYTHLGSTADPDLVAITRGSVPTATVEDQFSFEDRTYSRTTRSFADGATLVVLVPSNETASVSQHLFANDNAAVLSAIPGIDLRFFERYLGETLLVKPDNMKAGLEAVELALKTIDEGLHLIAVRIAIQGGPLASLFTGLRYDPADDQFHATTDRQLVPVYEALLDRVAATDAPLATLSGWKPFMDVIVGDFARDNHGEKNYGFLAQQILTAFEEKT